MEVKTSKSLSEEEERYIKKNGPEYIPSGRHNEFLVYTTMVSKISKQNLVVHEGER